jgi:AcrR family transcriptional regulator
VKSAPLRKIPTQDRSKQRVERILEAAGEVFAEVGYEAATTEAIAERAGVSIGSLYQFFPNKLAVFDALAEVYHRRERSLFEGLVNEETLALPWEDLLDRVIDAFYAFHRAEPAYRAIWQSFVVSKETVEAGQRLMDDFSRRVELALALHAPALAPAKRALVASVSVTVVTAMLLMLVRRPNEGDALIAETKLLLRRYLAPYAGARNARRAADLASAAKPPKRAPSARARRSR